MFAYCRTANQALGSAGQVIVIANSSVNNYPEFWLPWAWGQQHYLTEIAIPADGSVIRFSLDSHYANISLAPFQVRVFRTRTKLRCNKSHKCGNFCKCLTF